MGDRDLEEERVMVGSGWHERTVGNTDLDVGKKGA